MLFFKTTIFMVLAATFAGAVSVSTEERDLAQRDSCIVSGARLSCPSGYTCQPARGCCPRLGGACFQRRDGGDIEERHIADEITARGLTDVDLMEERDIVIEERGPSCMGPEGIPVFCPTNTRCVGGKGCCPIGKSGPCFFAAKRGEPLTARSFEEAVMARAFSEYEATIEARDIAIEKRHTEVEERDSEIDKRGCPTGQKLCNGNCILNSWMCCFGVGCPIHTSGYTCYNSGCGCAYRGSCSS